MLTYKPKDMIKSLVITALFNTIIAAVLWYMVLVDTLLGIYGLFHN